MKAYEKNWPHVCPICGKEFLGVKQAVYCSHGCADKAARKSAHFFSARAENEKKREERIERMKARDEEYEREYPGQQSGGVRGRIAAGGRCGVVRDSGEGVLVRAFIASRNEE